MKEGGGEHEWVDLPKQAAVTITNMVKSLLFIISLSTKLDVMLFFMFHSSFGF
jgi:hypothetical protein